MEKRKEKYFVVIPLIMAVFASSLIGYFFFFHDVSGEKVSEEEFRVIDNRVYLVKLDKDLIREKIRHGTEFLLRSENEEKHGFYKHYYPSKDSYGDELVTPYTTSIIYTLLYVNDLERNENILNQLPEWGDFLLSMQSGRNEYPPRYRPFHYSYHLDEEIKENMFVVGTNALSIFTLLELYEIYDEEKYLKAAKKAADWILTMLNSDGKLKPYVTQLKGDYWVYDNKEGILYQGQVLSALSRLYQTTGKERYHTAAKKIADRFVSKYEEEDGYIRGDFRDKGPMSNSWVVMSLLDFYKTTGKERYRKVVIELSELILQNQITDEYDMHDHGRWRGAHSTSGVGWICEVMSEVYIFKREQEMGGYENYKDAVVRGMRWIIQNTYSEEHQKNENIPERAIGGVFWNKDDRYVRTDSVCHALNSYVLIMPYLEDKTLMTLP